MFNCLPGDLTCCGLDLLLDLIHIYSLEDSRYSIHSLWRHDMANKENRQKFEPFDLLRLNMSFMPSRVLTAGVQLGVFSQIAGGIRRAKAIAEKVQATERGTRMVLDALVAMELLRKIGGEYHLTDPASRYLVRESADYIGGVLSDNHLWESWGCLTDIVRTGKPHYRVERQNQAEDFFPVLIKALHVANRQPARRAAQILCKGARDREMEALDVACGSGVWGIAVAQSKSTARVTAQDYPGILEITRQYARQHGVESRFNFLPGNLKEVKFDNARYDLAILGNIVHSEGEVAARSLFRRLSATLKPGGRMVIIDMVPNNQRTGPAFPIFFAINMLVNTSHGDTFTRAEYTAWLKQAGFKKVVTAEIGLHSPMLIATKPA